MSEAAQVRLRPGASPVPLESRTSRVALTTSFVLFGAFAVYTWLVVTWQPLIDLDEALNRNLHVHRWWPVLHVSDRVGQRAVCLPILIAAIGYVAWRLRSWRPVVVGAFGVFVVNLVVLIAKVAMARGAPLSGQSFFADGDLYPSGHTANVAVVYGLSYYLVAQYGRLGHAARVVLVGLLALIAPVMFATSLLLRWHWFSDLVGGFVIGGAVLALAIAADSMLAQRSRQLVSVPSQPPLVDLGRNEQHDDGGPRAPGPHTPGGGASGLPSAPDAVSPAAGRLRHL